MSAFRTWWSVLRFRYLTGARPKCRCNPQCSLRNTSRSGKLFHGKVLAILLVDENQRHANDLFSRNRVPPKRGFDFVGHGEHIAGFSH